MSDELKDFRYYADKAEEYLDVYNELDGAYTRQAAETLLRTAAVYAELAKAAPKVEPEPVLPCNVGLHGYREGMYDGTSRPCIFVKGHAGEHRTGDGVFFTGLDNANFPGLGGE
jgi:hypothetical protein